MNFTSGAGVSELLSLDHIRSQLIRLEDTIIFCKPRMGVTHDSAHREGPIRLQPKDLRSGRISKRYWFCRELARMVHL